MLCRCYVDLLPLKRIYKAQITRFTRSLSTQTVCLLPRGYTRHDRETRTLQWEDEHPASAPLPPAISTRTRDRQASKVHKDTRTIDNMDPVIKKYTFMLNDMRNLGNAIEKVNITEFGSIRFDEENIPRVHGQFDTEYEVDVKEYLKDNVPELQSGSQKILDISTSEKADESNDLYFLKDTDKTVSKDLHEMNYIDEQIFSEPFDRYQKESEMSYPGREADSQTPSITGQDQQGPEGALTNHCDLNYIDEVFFRNSLETLSENRIPSVEFSTVKEELENSLLNNDKQFRDKHDILRSTDPPVDLEKARSISLEYKEESAPISDKEAKQKDTFVEKEKPKSAYDYIVKRRREEHNKAHGLNVAPSDLDPVKKRYKHILSLLSIKKKEDVTKYEMLKQLKCSIIYNQYDIVGLYKPYGLAMHPGTESPYHTLTDYLPDLATFLKAEELYLVHRLDSTTTGVMLMARTPAMADTLKRMLKDRQLKKTYWAIAKGTPNPNQGIIDIPVSEGLIDGRRRMVLKPDLPGVKSTSHRSQRAVTYYKVMSSRHGVSLVELSPKTGVKHQLRVHLGFGLSCPVLGDHKYSHLTKLAPQRLAGDTLEKLGMKQSRVRELPMFLHSHSILLPEVAEGKSVVVRAQLPAYFNKALSFFHLNRKGNQILEAELSALT